MGRRILAEDESRKFGIGDLAVASAPKIPEAAAALTVGWLFQSLNTIVFPRIVRRLRSYSYPATSNTAAKGYKTVYCS